MVDYRSFRLSRCGEPEYRHAKYLLFWPIFGLTFYSLERLIPREFYHVMYHPIDDLIPFQELFVIPYVFWYFFMAGAVVYTFFRDTQAFTRYTKFLIITFGGGALIFLLFPTCQNLRPAVFPRENVLTDIMAALYRTDTNTNVLPSLHVCGSIGAALAFTDTKRFSSRGWKAFHFTVAALISVSTVFVKQHSVIDSLFGVAFSFLAWLVVYRIPKKN